MSGAVLGVLAARRRFGVGVLWLWVGAITMMLWVASGKLWPLRGPSGQRLYLGSGVIAPSLLLLLLLVYLEHGARDARRILGGIIAVGIGFQLINELARLGGQELAPVTWLHVFGSAISAALSLAVMSVSYQTAVSRGVRLPVAALFLATLLVGTVVDITVFPLIASADFGVLERLTDPHYLLSKFVSVAVLSVPAVIYLQRQMRRGVPLAVHEMSPLAIAGLGREGPVPDVAVWRSVAETLGDGLSVASGGRLVFANAAMARMAGLSRPDQIANLPFEAFVAEEDLPRLRMDERERHVGVRGTDAFEWGLRRPSGSYRRIATTSTLAMLGGRRVTVSLHRDVTDERETRRRLEATTVALQTLVATAAELVSSLDPATIVPALVERAQRLVGARGVAFLERSAPDGDLVCLHLIGDCGRLAMGSRIRAGLEAGWRAEAALERRHLVALTAGGLEHGLLVVAPDDAGTPFAWDQVALLDALGALGATALHTAHLLRDLRAAESRYAALFDQVPTPVWLHDPESGRILAVNAAALRRYGWSRGELLGMSMADLAPEASRESFVAALGSRAPSAGPEPALLARQRDRAGDEFDVLVSGSVVEVDGRRLGLTTCVDLTVERRNQERLQTSQRLEALGRLAGGIAHDFNNILTALLVDVGMLEVEHRDLPGLLAELAHIRAAAERAADLTRQVLLFSRGEEAKRRPVALNETVRSVERLLGRSLGETVALTVVLSPEAPMVLADPSQLHSALLNLCVNARDAMPRGGEVTVLTGETRLGAEMAERHGMASGPVATLTVVDTGVGMAPAVLARALEPFFTTKEPGQGTGLGLSIVHGVARAHGGAVEMVSAPGEGTRVTILLPVLERMRDTNAAAPLGELRGSETILLVDDEVSIRRAGSRMLSRFGYRVVLAEDGEDAVRRLDADAERIDLVVTDMVMPRMDARDLIGVIRERWPSLPVLLSTGYDAGRLGRGDAELFDGVIAKPYTPEEFLAAVRRALDAGL